jgi:hypothetical protein
VWGLGRAIALWGFNAVQQFRADSDIDLCRKVLIGALALAACSIANCPAKSYYFPATREAGLVQIANSIIEQSRCTGESLIFRFPGSSGQMGN